MELGKGLDEKRGWGTGRRAKSGWASGAETEGAWVIKGWLRWGGGAVVGEMWERCMSKRGREQRENAKGKGRKWKEKGRKGKEKIKLEIKG